MHCVAVGVRKYICAVIIYRLQGGTQYQLSTSKILWHSNHQYHDSCKHITTHCQCIMSSKVGIKLMYCFCLNMVLCIQQNEVEINLQVVLVPVSVQPGSCDESPADGRVVRVVWQ